MCEYEMLALAGVLIFQPLIALLWLVLAWRLSLRAAGNAIDERVNHAVDRLKGEE